jgi:hypothetical protein
MLILFVVAGSTVVSGQSGWKKLGDEHVNFDIDHDVINVNDSSRIRELRLRVDNAPIKFRRIVINYKDGVKQDVEYVQSVTIGGDSSVIAIDGDGHVISSVEFWYETASLGGKKAHITLYGSSTVTAAPVSTVVVSPDAVTSPVVTPVVAPVVAVSTAGWKKLGDENVNFDVDHDSINVEDSSRIRELRLTVMNAPIKFRRVVINYKDGKKHDMEYLVVVAMGGDSRVIAIEGDGHVIDSVEFWYETASLGGKKAQIILYGRS